MFIWAYAKNATLVPSKTRGKIGDVASERENISPRQAPGLVSRKRILGEEHAPHCQAHVVIVTSVGHEVDPDFTPQSLGQGASGRRSSQDLAYPVEEPGRHFRPHPIAQIELVARCGHGR